MDEKQPGIRPRPPLGLPAQAQLQQAVALACVYFWSVFRPSSMPPPAVFLLGLLADLLALSPVGSSVLILLAVHGFALRWRRPIARQNFLVVWLVFIAVAACAAAMGWALTCLLTFRFLSPLPAAFQAALSAGLYPVLALLFVGAHRSLADPQRA
jgi:rod shape-determining protein MreD